MSGTVHAFVADDRRRCSSGLRKFFRSVEDVFVREEPREQAFAYLCALLSHPYAGGPVSTDGRNRLLTTARWDEDRMRDRIRDMAASQVGNGGTLLVTEQGFLKKGSNSAGVERQFCSASGRAGNYQIGLFLLWADRYGTITAIDRELLLPPSWLGSPARRRSGGIPPDLPPATRDRLAEGMIARALGPVTPARVVAPPTPRVTALLAGHGIPHTATAGAEADGAARFFRAARHRAGLDRYSVRQWRAWYRHMTLSMLAHAFLTTTRPAAAARPLPATAHLPATGRAAA
ncbi:transposase [Streptomyces marincola]